ncbi:MAG: ABC transporter permease [Planctomycetota bacterium]|nr:ABC transporter permease [Planctomycetota bacterium]MDA1177319.1 ABC transporter permease [Planctomycetota bacterium]
MDRDGQVLAVVVGVVAACALLVWLAQIPLKYNIRNLKVRWPTTVLTALAFTLVVALLTVMLAFVNGMKALSESSGRDNNVLILSEGSTDESFSNLGFSDIGDIERQPGVLRDGDQPLCSHETYIVINQPIEDPPPGRQKRRFLQVRGLDDAQVSARVHGMELFPGGEWFSAGGVRKLAELDEDFSAIEVVVGEGIARELGQDRRPEKIQGATNTARIDVGDVVSLGNRRFVVVGVMKSAGTTFDSEVWAKRSVVGPLFGKESYTSLVLQTDDARAAESLANYFNTEYTKASVQAYTEPVYFRSLGETNRQFLVGIIFVAAVMAVGGVMGVMNTMFAAISQRIRDIGVMRLLGFQRWRILVSFLVESILISILGGILGCALGYLANGWTANSILSSGPGGGKFVVLRLVVDGGILGIGMLVSLSMGIVGGLLPAWSGMRKRPLESMK